MIIPDSFKTAIDNAFYDKDLVLYSKNVIVDADGWARQNVLSVSNSFKGNVHTERLEAIQKEYGIDEKIDLMITTSQDVPKDSIIGYKGAGYKVIDARPNDSHYLLFAKEWSSKSSTWISA